MKLDSSLNGLAGFSGILILMNNLIIIELDVYKRQGLRWLLRRLEICPNAYYNYRKHRKADYYANKAEVHAQIQEIYHIHIF